MIHERDGLRLGRTDAGSPWGFGLESWAFLCLCLQYRQSVECLVGLRRLKGDSHELCTTRTLRIPYALPSLEKRTSALRFLYRSICYTYIHSTEWRSSPLNHRSQPPICLPGYRFPQLIIASTECAAQSRPTPRRSPPCTPSVRRHPSRSPQHCQHTCAPGSPTWRP